MTLQLPTFSSNSLQKRFIQQSKNFYVQDDKLWKRHSTHPRLVILDISKHQDILQLTHDKLGHQGVYGTAKMISQWFWWPSYYQDVKHYVLRVAQATRSLRKSRPEIRKFGGFLEMASARALRLPSVTSRVFRTEIGTGFRNVPEWKVYRNNSECEYEDVRSGDSEYE